MPATADRPRITAVIAGNYTQFVFWCAEHDVSPRSASVLYATAQSLRGRSDMDIVRIGNWYGRDDFPEIRHRLAVLGIEL